jgi:hypothetical protein
VRLSRDRARPPALLTSSVLLAGVLAGCGVAVPSPQAQPSTTTSTTTSTTSKDTGPVVVVAVGDIACPPGARRTPNSCRQGQTARLAKELDPDVVLTLGDQQYEDGTLAAFRHSYAKSWGELRSITYPVPGNHEYHTPGARGYYRYFRSRQPGSPGYYARNLGHRWRLYALNSNCDEIACTDQYRWLRKDLRRHPRDCSLFTMHAPRWSSGSEHGSNASLAPFMTIAYHHHVELVLAGHDHDYERFTRMDPDGNHDRNGVVEMVAGAGGKSHYAFGDVVGGSAYRDAEDFGVLRLGLRRHRFITSFRAVDGTVDDRVQHRCR